MPCCSCWPWLSSAAVACPRARCCRPSVEPPVPEDAQARAVSLTRIGETALRSGEVETAVGLFEQATLTDGRNVTAALGLGDALLAAGRDLDASRAFERALAIQPDLPAAAYGYARAMIAIQRPEVAAEHLRGWWRRTWSSVEALNALGVAQDLLGDHARPRRPTARR